MSPLRALNQRFERWVVSRHRPQASPQTIRRGRCYILPTRPGFVFAFLLLAMLLGAMNYSNNLAFALTFLLGGVGLVAMHHTNANILGLAIHIERIPPVFAGDPIWVPVRYQNISTGDRYALMAGTDRTDLNRDFAVDCASGEFAESGFELPPAARGVHTLPRFTVASEFPLGLFQAWSWLSFESRIVVYPKPAPLSRPIPPSAGEQGQRSGQREGRDDFSHLRDYRPGDALRSIHWKSYPHSQRLAVKTFAEPQDEALWLDWHSLGDLRDVEMRLSQLCRWVLDCEASGELFGLRLPALQIEPGQGHAHSHQCLDALARFEAVT